MRLHQLFFIVPSLIAVLNGKAQSQGGVTTGAASYCDSINSGFISLTGFNGQILYWESSSDQGKTWNSIGNNTSTQSYNKLLKSTSFRAIVKDSAFPQDTSTISTITVYVPGQGGTLNGGGVFCGDAGHGAIELHNAAGSVLFWQSSLTSGQDWQTIQQNTSKLTYTSMTQNTLFRAIVQTVPGCPNDTSTISSFTIDQRTVAGTIFNSDTLCPGSVGDTLELKEYLGEILDWLSSNDNGATWKSLGSKSSFITYTTVTSTTWYKTLVKNASCSMELTSPAIVAIYPGNKANAGSDITITRYDDLHLNGSGNGTPDWNNASTLSDPNSFNPAAEPLNTTQYVLTVTDLNQCISRDTLIVNVIVPIPTAITPNGDGANDFFEIDKISDYPNNTLKVFNRWGTLVYEASSYSNNWNGTSMKGHDLPDDMYYYVFDFGNGEKAATNYILIKR
jgi:gliding motility-associated-like protein